MKKIFLILFVFSVLGVVSANAQDCCSQGAATNKNCMKYCQKSPKHCEKYMQKYCNTTCEAMEGCCTQTAASKTTAMSFFDTCCTYGRMNSQRGMMTVYRLYCLDSINFDISSLRQMPFNCMGNDSLWFELCLHRRDGKLYTTQVKAITSQGTISYDVSMQAPLQSTVESDVVTESKVAVYPNPTAGVLRVRLNNALTRSVTAQLVDAKGMINILQIDIVNGEAAIGTTGLSSGTYQLILKADDQVLSSSNFVVIR